jgi:hypothetical protein
MFTHRLATPDDMPALQILMTAAIRDLLPQFLPPEKVEASFAVMGVDSQLIEDGTYFILEEEDVMAGCGGWSRRSTLFGHNHTAGRDARLLDPASEPLYRACGYQEIERMEVPTPGGITVPITRMGKTL